jgi:hypothetical protein
MSKGESPDAAWWEALVDEIIAAPQKAIIDALTATGALTEADLQAALEGQEFGGIGKAGIAYHVKRLRKLNAVEVDAAPGAGRAGYRLTPKPGGGDGSG